ncbi:EF-hand domain-containing protein [Streptomyces noursei]|uniref:EF-hand domain-containing protein n=1 Tax=Streptomyces noursei TaxID=1971 RepID=UPI003450D149
MTADFRTRKITHWFALTDTDDDGLITAGDLDRALSRIAFARGLAPDSDHVAELRRLHTHKWRLLVEAAGLDAALDAVTVTNVIRCLNTLHNTPDEEQLLGLIADTWFSLVDADGDGKITFAEFAVALWANGLTDLLIIEAAFARVDADGDAIISREEARAAVCDFFQGEEETGPGAYLLGPVT